LRDWINAAASHKLILRLFWMVCEYGCPKLQKRKFIYYLLLKKGRELFS